MKQYVLHLVKADTLGMDGEVVLSLNVCRALAPVHLSDFADGIAELIDGYSNGSASYKIKTQDFDQRRIILKSEKLIDISINPLFNISKDRDPLNLLNEIPLARGQNLSGYIIRASSWGLS